MELPRAVQKISIHLRVPVEAAERLDQWRGDVSQAEAAKQAMLAGLEWCMCVDCKEFIQSRPVKLLHPDDQHFLGNLCYECACKRVALQEA